MPTTPDDPSLYRILDANFNRCQEGLRVLEEVVRFRHDQARLAEKFKDLRHHLARCLPDSWRQRFLVMRSVSTDVGREIAADDEYRRTDVASVVAANASRIKQAFRAIEEFSKPLSSDVSRQVEQLRYEFYHLEQAICLRAWAVERIGNARVYVLVDGAESEEQFVTKLDRILKNPPDVIQLRDKALADRPLLARAKVLREKTRLHDVLMVINDRPDIARLCDADGVHVGQDELSVDAVRRIVGPEMLIGVSTHALDQAQRAVDEGAQYLGAGPTFASQTKTFTAFAGLDYLRQIAEAVEVPTFAIGGITPDNVDQVLETGLRRIAVSGCVAKADDPATVIEQLRARISSYDSEARDGV